MVIAVGYMPSMHVCWKMVGWLPLDPATSRVTTLRSSRPTLAPGRAASRAAIPCVTSVRTVRSSCCAVLQTRRRETGFVRNAALEIAAPTVCILQRGPQVGRLSGDIYRPPANRHARIMGLALRTQGEPVC